MHLEITRVPVEEITPLRELHRQEMNCQIIHDSFPRRGFSDAYLLRSGGRIAGYGLVANRHWPDTVHEFHTFPADRADSAPLFRRLMEVSGATRILAQTNDPLLLLMLYDCAENITAGAILFEDAFTSHLSCPEGEFRKVAEADREPLREADLDADAGWMIEIEGIPVAAGGVLCHYNPPYGDIYMGVRESHRRRGFGSYLVQELKRVAYESGKRPAARCSPSNMASRKTMEKAGLLPCGRLLEGDVTK
ncbi:MAG: GNAT family N-acetyltransferase [Armatimonadetes bacterium]|nr:GNAT family N-acetyltransferase [Armatimonadota bacterium]